MDFGSGVQKYGVGTPYGTGLRRDPAAILEVQPGERFSGRGFVSFRFHGRCGL